MNSLFVVLLLGTFLLAACVVPCAQAVVIDDWTAAQGPVSLTYPPSGSTTSSTASGAGIVGVERDVRISLSSGSFAGNGITATVASGQLSYGLDPATVGTGRFEWDGADGDATTLDPVGLGGIDFTESGTKDGLLVSIFANDVFIDIVLTVYTDGSNSSTFTLNLPSFIFTPENFVVPFSAFSPALGAGADFTNVGAMTLEIGGAIPVDLVIEEISTTSLLTATKVDAVLIDNDVDGQADPGDTVQYTVVIRNLDDSFDAPATGVVFSSGVDPNTALVVGSATTDRGVVTSGNNVGDASVEADIGSIVDGGSVTLTFNVIIDNPFPAGLAEIACQGLVTSDGLLGILTDDPDTVAPNDPTATPVDAAPDIRATKVDSLFIDNNGDNQANPGDRVRYEAVITNVGDQDAANVLFSTGVDVNSALVVGSASTTQGAITSGNSPGNTTVVVNVGTIPGANGSVTIWFDVDIDYPFPAGIDEIRCQGLVSGGNFAGVATDDPDTPASGDSTDTPVDAAPTIVATKSDSLYLDNDNDHQADPGDSLRYTVKVANVGDRDASGVVFATGVDPRTNLVFGSVATSRGAVTTGNGAGDSSVAVQIGALAGASDTVTITFLVTVVNPFPIGDKLVSCQGLVTGANFADTVTDDPETPDPDDPTITPIDAAPDVRVTKADFVQIDNDGDGKADPGDTVRYTVVITNHGNQHASQVDFSTLVPANTTLVVGSVTTFIGTVTDGNDPGDTAVAVDVGTLLAGGGTEVITFLVILDPIMPANVDEISCQGLVTGGNFPATPTDDPDTAAPADPTVTVLDAAPIVYATKTDLIVSGGDDGDPAGPGDTIRYTVRISNTGNQDASGVYFNTGVDPNTALVVGSVSTTQGVVIVGNNPGNATVSVMIGALPAGPGIVTVVFEVTVDDPLPPELRQVSCQGLVSGENFDNTPTDDPDTPAANDPTVTAVMPPPTVTPTQTFTLTPTVTRTPTPTPTFACVQAASLTVSCSGGIGLSGRANDMRLRFYMGDSEGPEECTVMNCGEHGTLLVDCLLDPSGLDNPSDCDSAIDAFLTDVASCITDQSGGWMTWSYVTGSGSLYLQSKLPFFCCLCGSELDAACQLGEGYPLSGCPIYNLWDGNPDNETDNEAGFTSGLGIVCLEAPCPGQSLPTPTGTATATDSPTATVTSTEVPSHTFTPTPTATATFACVQAASISISCKGDIRPPDIDVPEDLRIRLYEGTLPVSECEIGDFPDADTIVDYPIDCAALSGAEDCDDLIELFVAGIGESISDQAGSRMMWSAWRSVTGVPLGLYVQSEVPFYSVLCGTEVEASCSMGNGYPLDLCPVYNLCDGTLGNETHNKTDFSGGIGLAVLEALCPDEIAPTPTATPPPPDVCDSGYYLLDSFGGRHRVGNPVIITGSLYFGSNIARDMERAVCQSDEDLVVLDGYGAVQFVMTTDCAIGQDFYFGGQAGEFPEGRARDVEMSLNSTGFWVLTDFGGIYRAGTTKEPADPALVPGTDQSGVLGLDVPLTGNMRDPELPEGDGSSLRAVSLVVIDSDGNGRAEGYIVLDSMGGRLHYDPNGAPVTPGSSSISPENDPARLLDPTGYVWPFFKGLDIARDMELHSTQQGVVILDGWDGIHPVPVDIEDNPVYFATNRTSNADDTPVQLVGMPYITKGFDNPETDGLEDDPDLFGIDTASIFRDLEFSAGCSSGLYTLDKFGGVFVLGEAREDPNIPTPLFGSSPYFLPYLYAEDMEVYAFDEIPAETDTDR
jgi:uncharacterized repeat protein (TIGR01451 family)